MLRIGKHTLDHFFGLIPISVHARVHKLLAGSRSTTMCGDDLGDNGNELINDLHGPTSLDYHIETALTPAGFQSTGALVANATRRGLRVARPPAGCPSGVARCLVARVSTCDHAKNETVQRKCSGMEPARQLGLHRTRSSSDPSGELRRMHVNGCRRLVCAPRLRLLAALQRPLCCGGSKDYRAPRTIRRI